MTAIQLVSQHACFGGVQQFYKHDSVETQGPMRFSVYLPSQIAGGKVPVLYYLAGLTCNEETFATKAHAQAVAGELGLMLVAPDTSPRLPRIPGDDVKWDFGQGAGFYVDATQQPWSTNYRMDSYVTRELPQIIRANFPAAQGASGIFGHSMGGHGALTLALRNPTLYKSLSAFAPISAPMHCPWGVKAFTNYLGSDSGAWRKHDASELLARRPFDTPILVDQGTGDQFLADQQLLPEKLSAAATQSGQRLTLRMQPGYDHGYYFIQTFMADHLKHHAEILKS